MNRLITFLNTAAIIISFASPLCYLVIMLLVFTLKWPAGLGTGLFYSPFAFVFALLAAYKPLIGGILLLISGSLLFTASLTTNHDIEYYLPIASFAIIGGILHLIRTRYYIPD